jgi:glycosyltransferase involved in cell wall biosynthesis
MELIGLMSASISNRPINLLFITSNLSLGGAERQLFYLIRGLDKNRFQASVVPIWPDYTMRAQFEAAGAAVIPIHKRWKYDFSLLFRLSAFIKRLQPDIVQCQMYTANMWGRVAAKMAGSKIIVVSERNSDYLWKTQWHFAAERCLNRYASAFLGNSCRVCRYCEENLKLREGTFSLMHNGVDVQEFTPSESNPGQIINPIIGTVANLYPNKDLPTFLRMAAYVLNKWPKARFRIVGYGTELNSLKDLAADLGIVNQVQFVGASNSIANEYKCFDIFVLSSVHEGFANVIIEAMASGIPVIATNVGAASETIVEGKSGFMVPSRNPDALAARVNDLLQNPDLRKSMGDFGRQIAMRKFSLESMVKRYELLYLELVSRPRKECAD